MVRAGVPRVALLPCVLSVALCACGGPSLPRQDPLDYFRAGVDPQAEADAVVEGLEEGGWALRRRFDGPDGRFVLLELEHPGTSEAAVRIVTSRGVAFSVSEVEARYGDVGWVAEGDVVAVRRWDPARGRNCLTLVDITGAGAVGPARVPADHFPDDACIEALRDVGGDRTVEAMVGLRAERLARSTAPRIEVPLVHRGERWVVAPPRAFGAYWERERATRLESLAEARRARDVEGAYRLGVELALVARQAGNGRHAQVRAFDEALRGLVLQEGQARAVRAARGHISEGWGGEEGDPPEG